MTATELPLLTSENDWLYLRTGDKGLLRGKVQGDHVPGKTQLLISFSDWSSQLIDLQDQEGLPDFLPDSKTVEVIVTASEDGLLAISNDISERPDC